MIYRKHLAPVRLTTFPEEFIKISNAMSNYYFIIACRYVCANL